MLELKNVKKEYYVGEEVINALNGISLTFKKNEFVSILGPSGCGKTTLLNIIGGLDKYSSGDLLIDNKSTKNFKDTDWDAYRNSTIGFVFQNYNLISHLSVLDNVEMALRLSGISSKERKERAAKVLNEVGLGDQLNKRPNQLSGGQMQRVAIARALVNNPKVLLADEPTGALDSKTSTQIMNLIQEISKDRLVIMVTHNSEIAKRYSDRIINLLDGKVVDDSRPTNSESVVVGNLHNKKTSMSYLTALKTSFKNLLTKKGRTIITAFAGSIGIIGIALVLSISGGMTTYVNELQSDTLAGFPLTIDSIVFTDIFADRQNQAEEMMNGSADDFPTTEKVYFYDKESSMKTHNNVLDQNYLDYLQGMDSKYYNSISYTRDIAMNIVAKTNVGGYTLVKNGSSGMFSSGSNLSEMPNNPDFIKSQYDLLGGSFPTQYGEVVLVVDKKNRIDKKVLDAFGIEVNEEYNFNDFIDREFKVITNNEIYKLSELNFYVKGTNYEEMYKSSNSITIKIAGILRINPDATGEILSTGINYTSMLTDHILNIESNSDIVIAQKANPNVDVTKGTALNPASYKRIMQEIGGDATPSGVQIYPVSFEAKDEIKKYLDEYNVGKPEESKILYTDLAEIISSTMSSFIDTIAIILSAFAGISLVVSSIMIGIITYVSVVERTKEIGIMRSLGARKRDISRIFNAETLIIGFTAGTFGVLLAIILNIPLNLIIEKLIDVPGFSVLSLSSAVILILLSTVLTLIAGLFPSRIAANKDPVVALRTE
jgi:putative ABC transport system permease protein